MSTIRIIAALGNDHVIGLDGRIPWKSKADMQHFKQRTTGCTVIMGRKTWESIGRRCLPERLNIVVSSQGVEEKAVGVISFAGIPTEMLHARYLGEAIRLADEHPYYGSRDIWLIGGERIYREGFAVADELVLTRVPYTCPPEDLPRAVRFPSIPGDFDECDSKELQGDPSSFVQRWRRRAS